MASRLSSIRLKNKLAQLNRDWPDGTKVRVWPGTKEGPGLIGEIRGEWFIDCTGKNVVVFTTACRSYVAAAHVWLLTKWEIEQTGGQERSPDLRESNVSS